MTRVAIVCPGRGSYSENTRGRLPREHPFVQQADELRRSAGLTPLSELDHEGPYQAEVHLGAMNASPLIWLTTMIEASEALETEHCVAVLGNSLGWYTALAVAGALSFEEGFQLVQGMAELQETVSAGGQLLYPEVGDDWRPDSERIEHVSAALAAADGEAFRSIRLGGVAVLAGTEQGVEHLMGALPPVQLGRTRYPLRLFGHGPFHTPLLEEVARQAHERFRGLNWQRPSHTLIDGRGTRHTPWSADPAALAEYTLGAQVVDTFDFSSALRVTLREFAPDRLVLPGPGNSLGGICGQVLVAEGWRGVRSKEDFDALQSSESAVLSSLWR